jgi:regulatory protein
LSKSQNASRKKTTLSIPIRASLDRQSGRDVVELLRTGLVDDERFARARASSLAERGAGNALIRARLAEVGVAHELVDDAIGAVEPEATRARRIVARRGASPKTARYLYGKGFSEEVVSAALRTAPTTS